MHPPFYYLLCQPAMGNLRCLLSNHSAFPCKSLKPKPTIFEHGASEPGACTLVSWQGPERDAGGVRLELRR